MTLMDIVSSHIQQAKQKVKKYKVQQKVKNIHEGSITDLSAYRDKTFDAVICL